MRKALIPIALTLVGLLEGCAPAISPVSPDSSAIKSYFSDVSPSVKGSMNFFNDGTWTLRMDSAGIPLSRQPGDTLIFNGIDIPRADSQWTWSSSVREIVDSGVNIFTFIRGRDSTRVTATFSLPVVPFRVLHPADGDTVSFATHANDTIRYERANGTDVVAWFEYGQTIVKGPPMPDNGAYSLFEVAGNTGAKTGYLFLTRHSLGTLANAGGFSTVQYDYYQSRKILGLKFN